MYTMDEDGKMDTVNLVGLDGEIMFTSRKSTNSDEWYLYNQDTRGSTSSVIDDGGTVAAAYEYDAFGNTTARIGENFDNELCYTGQVYDKETGLYYYNARFYDPEDGRFLTQDTYRGEQMEPGTWHLYIYCANNPINSVDPSGHKFVRTYTRNQCRNTYVLFCAIEKTYKLIGYLTSGRAIAKQILNRAYKKALKLVLKDFMKSVVTKEVLKKPRKLYAKMKKGFKYGGYGIIKITWYSKKGKRKLVKKRRTEKIKRTKLIAYSVKNFKFYFSSKNAKNVPMPGN